MAYDLLKVMIVEDERLVRNLLKACIDWKEIGMQIVGESSNAVEGLELVDKLLPDIIFTDICMPLMDGLEFSRRVVEKHPHIKIVILTGHEEFEYAKKGIKVGIADFLLKPINDDEIRRTAVAIKEKIIKERTHTEEYDRLKKQLEQNLPFLKEKLLNELLQSSVDLAAMLDKTAYFGIKMKEDKYRVAVVEVGLAEDTQETDEERKLIFKMRCLETVEQFFKNDAYVHVFHDNSQRIVILCNDESVDMEECCETIRTMIINKLKCYVCIGLGNSRHGLEKIWLSYREACDALRYGFVVGKNQVIGFSEICATQEEQPNIENDLISSFSFYLKAGLKEKAEEIVYKAFHEVGAGIASKEQAQVIGCNFISAVLNVLMEAGVNQREVFFGYVQPFEKIFKIDTLPEMKEFLKSTAISAVQAVNSLQGKKARKIIQDVREYINQNFSDANLTLSEVAKKHYVNLSYLSRIFKEETGQTFVDYLMKLRMEKAVKLLNETDLKSYEISEEVGIKDPHYFSVCFKKYTGFSVNDYKKMK